MASLKYKVHYNLHLFKLSINKPEIKIMTEVTLDIRQWGNNLGVRLPAAIAQEAGLKRDQRVKLSVVNKTIVISPAETTLSLEERLNCFDPQKHGGEIMQTVQTIGAEHW
jgi:antitoxin MazE